MSAGRLRALRVSPWLTLSRLAHQHWMYGPRLPRWADPRLGPVQDDEWQAKGRNRRDGQAVRVCPPPVNRVQTLTPPAAPPRRFYEHIKARRVDPSYQSVNNPTPDYYGALVPRPARAPTRSAPAPR